MIKIIVVVGTKTGKTYQKEIEEEKNSALIGLKIGESFDGSIIGLTGYTLEITGGSDKQGFPLRKNVIGSERRSLILKGGVGLKSIKYKGLRKRKSVRGNTISEEVVQLNTKVVKEGKESVETLWAIGNSVEQEQAKVN